MKKQVFKIHPEYNHSGDTGFDGTVIELENMKDTKYLNFYYQNYALYKNRLPTKVFIQANFSIIFNYDLPFVNPKIPIFSNRMFHLLNNLGKNEMLELPVILISDTYFGQIFDNDNPQQLLPSVPTNMDYTSIVFKENIDFLDNDKSTFEDGIIDPTIKIVSNHIMKEPKAGFPPIFREKHNIVDIFVSEEAKKVIEASDIKGCVFVPVEVTPYS